MQSRRPFRSPVLASLSAFTLAVLVAASTIPAPNASGQYFGRNQVLWEDFDFHILETPHFDVYYYPEQNQAIEDAARMGERWYQRLAEQFGYQFSEKKPVILYADHADFQQTTVGGGLIGEGTGGFTEPLRGRLVMPLTGAYADTDHVLGHEMVHEFQFDIAKIVSPDPTGSALRRLPLWMVEGLAEYLSVGPVDTHTAMWLRDAAFFEELPTMKDLNRKPNRYFPYRFGHAFWAYVAGRWGNETALRFFVGSMEVGVDEASRQLLGMTGEELSEAWREAIRADYEPILEGRDRTDALGEPLISGERGGGDLNLAPSLSPDGRYLALLSSRDLVSIDLYLADARTGEVLRKLVSADSDPHFDALRFLDSAGGWSPDGRKLAFVVFEEGDNRLAILDVESRRVERRYELPGVGALSSPSYSPDGRQVVVSGIRNGVSDLYVVDLASGDTRRLTDDLHADLQPVWSPDGRTLAFISDRGPETDFETLTYSSMQLALLDVASGAVRSLPVFPDAKHVNPQFSPDGRSLYFIADPDGISDVFRVAVDGGEAERVTRVLTGVSGITALAPALSVAQQTGEVAVSLFKRGDYEIHTFGPDGPASPAARAVPVDTGRRAAVLPPLSDPGTGDTGDRRGPLIESLRDAESGLPPEDPGYEVEDYDAKLGLEFLGPPTVGASSDEFGLGLAGGVSLYFSDILGRHQVGVTLSGQGGSSQSFGSSFGGQVSYLNRTGRLQYGASAAHVPYLSGRTFFERGVIEIDGQQVPADVVQQVREEVTVDQVGLLGSYPLSLNRRFEAQAFYTQQDFDRRVDQVVLVGDQIIDRQTLDLPSPEGVGLFEGTVAFVHDTSYFGFTAPIRGTRARIEVGTVGGDLSFQTARLDYRRYFFARPATFAFRAFHFGRYGDDSESDRISPLFIGRESLVRGYAVDSFSATECTPTDDLGCPEFDRLLGSKVGIGSFEVRIPLLGTEELGLIYAPYVPTDLVFFTDAGVAWTEDDSPELAFEEDSLERVPVVSAGISLRTLLLGYLPLEVYAAVPFQRPDEDVVYGFAITPGW
jgi:hypothetical protein